MLHKKGLPAGRQGKMIVLYGVNNLGKTTQAKLLVKEIKKIGKKAEYIKYPLYDTEPTGKLINEYLRKGNPYKFSPREFQLLNFADNIKYEKVLEDKLKKGINIVVEDYFGTAVAWGMATEVEEKLLDYLWKFIKKEDLAFLLCGKRFLKSREKNHKHERDGKLMEKAKKIHLKLGKKHNWHKIDVSLPLKEKHAIIWEKVRKII